MLTEVALRITRAHPWRLLSGRSVTLSAAHIHAPGQLTRSVPRERHEAGMTVHARARETTTTMVVCPSTATVPSPVRPRSTDTSTATQQHARLAKRKVAIFVAYVGSAFRGLQIQRDQPGGTVEDVLQQALNSAGCILPSNYGNLPKIAWSRSSRTDKGVHALANVLAMKLECDPDSFVTDPEGSELAYAINQHLPAEVMSLLQSPVMHTCLLTGSLSDAPKVQVLSVQRVNGGFNARGHCNTRTYHYYLPASILGLALDGSAEDKERLAALRQCCSLYEGNHPFHNYTKRRLYRIPTADAMSGASRDLEQPTAEAGRSTGASEVSEQELQHLNLDSTSDSASTRDNGLQDWETVEHPEDNNSSRAGAVNTNRRDSDDAAEPAIQTGLRSIPRPLQYRWLDEMDPRDRLAPAHYRFINSISVDDPMPLGSGATSAVKVSITGSSFMLHQIRHMVGAAVAVARGDVPLEFVSASLCAPARAVLPLAPPQVLVLASSEFQPFPSDGLGVIQSMSGPQLQLRAEGQTARDSFAQQVLHPAIEHLFQHDVWAEWDNDLKLTTWQDSDFRAFAQKAEHWRIARAAISSAKQEALRNAGTE